MRQETPGHRGSWLRRCLAWFWSIITGAVVLVGIPALLILTTGSPVPHALPSSADIADWHVTESILPKLIAGLGWLLWAAILYVTATRIASQIGASRLPSLRLPRFVDGAVAGLVGTLSLPFASTAHAAMPTAPADPVSAQPQARLAADVWSGAQDQTVTIVVQKQRHTVIVHKYDTLSSIAKAWLGDADRWPEICRLNKHRHFARTGGTLRDCDLIYPGWDLRLPADARPPVVASPPKPREPKAPDSTSPPAAQTTVPAGTPSATAHPSAAPSTPADERSVPPSATSSANTPSTSGASQPVLTVPTPSAASDPDDTEVRTDEHGVQLSRFTWLPWSLALAITAAGALVWLQRRRTFRGDGNDAPLTELPEPVLQIERAVSVAQLDRPEAVDAERPTASTPSAYPGGGVGLVGEGAHAAARGVLVAALASGEPGQAAVTHHEVILDAAVLRALLGADTKLGTGWPRLHVTHSRDEALGLVEAQLLHRARILDEHTLNGLDEVDRPATGDALFPPVTLIVEAPPADSGVRLNIALGLGRSVNVSAVLLGEWTHGATVEISPDGYTTTVQGALTDELPRRWAVLDQAAAFQLLRTLREAQTGQPTEAASSPKVIPLQASRTVVSAREVGPEPPGLIAPASERARIRVLGTPRIEGVAPGGLPLRAKALEMAVFLAVHPEGADARRIGDNLAPEVRIAQATERVHTWAYNLRQVLSRAGTAGAQDGYVIKTAGRYRLNPDAVEVDVWTLRDLISKASLVSGDGRQTLLAAACELCRGPLADGQIYDWLTPHREAVRRWSTEAHLRLSDEVLESDPEKASALLVQAIGFDKYNETLYTKAMLARHAAGDILGARTAFQSLVGTLAGIDAEPSSATVMLMEKLERQSRLEQTDSL